MKRFVLLIAAIAGLAYGCTLPERPEKPTGGGAEGMVRVLVGNPRQAGADAYSAVSRAWEANGKEPADMEPYSTFRLYVYNSLAMPVQKNPYPPELVGGKTYTYRVTGPDDPAEVRTRGAVMCTVDPKTGAWLSDVTDTDLHLPASRYDFFAISPAVELENKTVGWPEAKYVPTKQIQHGGLIVKDRFNRDSLVTLMTTAPKWGVNIAYGSSEVGGGHEGFYNLQPELFTLLTARVKFIIKKGKDVEELAMHPYGVVLSGLSFDAYRPNFILGEQELDPMRAGEDAGENAKPGQVTITNYQKIETGDDYHYELVTELIPSAQDSETEVQLAFNLYVNGENYKEYKYSLGERSFKRGYSYTYEVTVNAGGIFVRGWTDIGWTATIPR